MPTTKERLLAAGVSPKYVDNTASKLDTLDPRLRPRFEAVIIQFYREYGGQGYEITIEKRHGATRAAAEQDALNKDVTVGAAAKPENTWHLVGASADFWVEKDGVYDDGRGGPGNNAYYDILRPIAFQNGLFNGVLRDPGHFQPSEVPLSRRGKTLLDVFPDSISWTGGVRPPPLPDRRVAPPNDSRVFYAPLPHLRPTTPLVGTTAPRSTPEAASTPAPSGSGAAPVAAPTPAPTLPGPGAPLDIRPPAAAPATPQPPPVPKPPLPRLRPQAQLVPSPPTVKPLKWPLAVTPPDVFAALQRRYAPMVLVADHERFDHLFTGDPRPGVPDLSELGVVVAPPRGEVLSYGIAEAWPQTGTEVEEGKSPSYYIWYRDKSGTTGYLPGGRPGVPALLRFNPDAVPDEAPPEARVRPTIPRATASASTIVEPAVLPGATGNTRVGGPGFAEHPADALPPASTVDLAADEAGLLSATPRLPG
jgi:hypothetical protein